MTVGHEAPIYLPGVIIAVSAPYVTVRCTDDLDLDNTVSEIVARGTGAVNDKVMVLMQPTGRATLIRS